MLPLHCTVWVLASSLLEKLGQAEEGGQKKRSPQSLAFPVGGRVLAWSELVSMPGAPAGSGCFPSLCWLDASESEYHDICP